MKKSLQKLLLAGILGFCLCEVAWCYDLPPLGELPELGWDWVFQEADKSKLPGDPVHWIVFRHSVSGDYLSMSSFPPDSLPKPDMIHHWDTAHENFPDGLPVWKRLKADQDQKMLVNPIFSEAIQMKCHDSRSQKPFKADVLKYCFVTETEVGKNLMSHGRCWSGRKAVVYIQHTSTTPITMDFVESTTRSLIQNQERAEGPKIGE